MEREVLTSGRGSLPFASTEADLVRYGAISPLAIGALALGALSAVSLASLLALFIPVFAVLAAVAALRQIDKSDGAIVGRWAAVAGLTLALLFASTAIARLVSREIALRGQARRFADQWLQLVREGKLQQAHQLQLAPADRQLPGVSLDQFYASSPAARDQLNALFGADPLRSVARAPRQAQLRLVRFGQHFPAPNRDQLELFYELRQPRGGPAPRELMIVVERTASSARGPGTWRVIAVADPGQQLAL